MRMGRALSDAFSAVTRGGPTTYAGLVQAVGGAAKASSILKDAGVGVGKREVERQVAKDKASRGETTRGKAPGKQQRGYSEKQYKALEDAAEAKEWSKERDKFKDGMRAHVAGDFRISQHKSERDLEVTIDDPDALNDLFDALEAHDYKAASEVFNDAFMDAYGTPGAFWANVDELDISPA